MNSAKALDKKKKNIKSTESASAPTTTATTISARGKGKKTKHVGTAKRIEENMIKDYKLDDSDDDDYDRDGKQPGGDNDKDMTEEEKLREQLLEDSLFGSAVDNLKKRMKETKKKEQEEKESDNFESLFTIDRSGVDVADDGEDAADGSLESKSKKAKKDKKVEEVKPAWKDEDDENVTIDISKISRLKKLRTKRSTETITGAELEHRLRNYHDKRPTGGMAATIDENRLSWAKIPKKSKKQEQKDQEKKEKEHGSDSESDMDEDEDDGVANALTTTQSLLAKSSSKHAANVIRMDRVPDANQNSPSRAVVQAIDWRKSGKLFLTGGYDQHLRIFEIDGKENPVAQSVYFDDLPISTARFAGPDHNEILISGKRSFYYTYDLVGGVVKRIPGILGRSGEKNLESFEISPNGSFIAFMCKGGFISILDYKTKQNIGLLKQNESVKCAAFTNDNLLYTSGAEGNVYIWDLRKMGGFSPTGILNSSCIKRHHDHGSLGSQSIAVMSNGSRYAVGSTSGVVNVYDENLSVDGDPTPLKAVMNLTTSIDNVSFSHDGELLAFSSRRKKDSIKILHMKTLQVVKNWPTMRTPFSYVECAKFSPNTEYLSVGNDKGKVLLWKVKGY